MLFNWSWQYFCHAFLFFSDKADCVKYLIGKGNVGDTIDVLNSLYLFNTQLLEDAGFNSFLSDPKEKFDVILVEWFFSDLLAG